MIGFSIGKYIPFSTEGLGFALTALFVVLLIEQLVSCRKKLPFIIAGCVAVGTFLLAGRDNMLIISLVVSIAALMVLRRRLE
jgi:4-azaleucine resistance transporter AzlC